MAKMKGRTREDPVKATVARFGESTREETRAFWTSSLP